MSLLFGPSALQLRMKESVAIFAAYDVIMILGRDARQPHIEAVFLTDVYRGYRVHEENIHSSTCFSCLWNLCSPYHASQEACADLVFEPTLKRQKRWEKPNFERNFLTKKLKMRRNNSTDLTLLILGFPKTIFGKNCWFWPSVLLCAR